MTVFTAVRTARKQYTCCHCRENIEPGRRYERHTMSPDDEHNDGNAWRTAMAHLPADCPLAREA